MEREQEDNLRHEMDQEFDSLRSLIYAPDPSSTGSNSVPLGHARPNADDASSYSALPGIATKPIDLDYDQQVRELAFDQRAKPKNRTKTEEEIALETKEALEKAERRRRRRMLGEDDVDSDEEAGKSRGNRKRKAGGDDLDDDFADEEPEWLGAGLGEEAKVDEEEGSDASEDEEDGSEGGSSGEEEGDGDEDGSEEESEEDVSEGETGEHEDLVPSKVSTSKQGKPKPAPRTAKEIPFTFPCPSTHEEFLDIVDGIDDGDVPTVVQRIRALYHPSLGIDNKFKLQVCYYSRPRFQTLNLD